MTGAVRRSEEQREATASQRLKALQDKAAAIREKHRAGKIDSEEAARQLSELKRRPFSLLDVLVSG